MLDINILKISADEMAANKKVQQEFEQIGNFNQDEHVNTFDGCEPVDETFDYYKRGFVNRIKHWFYTSALKIYQRNVNRDLTNLKIVGQENLRGLKGGYIVTCNHISKVDSFAVRAAIPHKIKFVAADFNNWKGILGDISRHTGYLPICTRKTSLSMTRKFNQALEYFLNHNWPILIYPEQALWTDYKKPRPLKRGAFHYAVKFRKPVLPLFITIQDKPAAIDAQGRANYGDYTIHILPPIYPDSELDDRANTDKMMMANFCAWRDCYEQTYGQPLTYDIGDPGAVDSQVKVFLDAIKN